MKGPRGVGLFVAAACLTALAEHPAAAQEREACFSAASEGQILRDEHRLLEARDRFRVCSQSTCPSSMRGDCAQWLDAVELVLPTVVFSATDASGVDQIDVKISVDGRLLVSRIEGTAVAIDPGPHAFRFETPGGRTVEERVVIAEGQKAVPVAVAFPPARPRVVVPENPRESKSGWATWGWALGAAGAASLAAGTIAGVLAIADRSSANCDSAGRCDLGPLADARNAARVSDITLGVGGVLLASGVAVLILSPGSHSKADEGARSVGLSRVDLAPFIATSGAGLVIGGAW
jgi:hypothetical protein